MNSTLIPLRSGKPIAVLLALLAVLTSTVLVAGGSVDAATGCFGEVPTIYAVSGETTVGTDRRDIILGSPGDDTIYAGRGNDLICGMGGNDKIIGESGDDAIYGGDGNDYIRGRNGNDFIMGMDGRDNIKGGPGADWITGGDQRDRLYGESGDDILNGGSADDVMYGGAGNDFLDGHTGDDLVCSGSGDNKLIGGGGNDRLCAESGVDYLNGGSGNDIATGHLVGDTTIGGVGSDTGFGAPPADFLGTHTIRQIQDHFDPSSNTYPFYTGNVALAFASRGCGAEFALYLPVYRGIELDEYDNYLRSPVGASHASNTMVPSENEYLYALTKVAIDVIAGQTKALRSDGSIEWTTVDTEHVSMASLNNMTSASDCGAAARMYSAFVTISDGYHVYGTANELDIAPATVRALKDLSRNSMIHATYNPGWSTFKNLRKVVSDDLFSPGSDCVGFCASKIQVLELLAANPVGFASGR